jgi:hypothetical protein
MVEGAPVTRIVLDTYDLHDKGLYGGGGFDFRYPFPPLLSALNMPPDGPQWGSGFKRTLRRVHNRAVQCWGHMTSLPVGTNAVDLDPEAKDSCHPRPKEHGPTSACTSTCSPGIDLLKAAGAVRTWGGRPATIPAAPSLVSTCRMGNDRVRVGASNRAHDVPTCSVDGSSFVTAGRSQPTLTIRRWRSVLPTWHWAGAARAGLTKAGSGEGASSYPGAPGELVGHGRSFAAP